MQIKNWRDQEEEDTNVLRPTNYRKWTFRQTIHVYIHSILYMYVCLSKQSLKKALSIHTYLHMCDPKALDNEEHQSGAVPLVNFSCSVMALMVPKPRGIWACCRSGYRFLRAASAVQQVGWLAPLVAPEELHPEKLGANLVVLGACPSAAAKNTGSKDLEKCRNLKLDLAMATASNETWNFIPLATVSRFTPLSSEFRWSFFGFLKYPTLVICRKCFISVCMCTNICMYKLCSGIFLWYLWRAKLTGTEMCPLWGSKHKTRFFFKYVLASD